MTSTTTNNKVKRRKNVEELNEDDEKLTLHNIKEMFECMLAKHEHSITSLIKANNKINEEKIESLTKHIDDFQRSLEYTENELQEKVEDIELSVNNRLKDMEDKFTNEHVVLKNKIRDLEDRSRRNNLRIDGIKEQDSETWLATKESVKSLFKNHLKIETDIIIERAHRIKPTKQQRERELPRTIVLKLHNYEDKETILKNISTLKDTGIYINEDYSKETMVIRQELWKKVLELRKEGKYAILQYDKIYSRNFY